MANCQGPHKHYIHLFSNYIIIHIHLCLISLLHFIYHLLYTHTHLSLLRFTSSVPLSANPANHRRGKLFKTKKRRMRPGTTFSEAFHNPTSSPSPLTSPDGLGVHSAWRSPVPYLFGGLAAMLGLIALALLTLACTYWRLTGYLNSTGANGEMNSHGAARKGTGAGDSDMAPPVKVHVAVIMAGEVKPTYLATPTHKKDVGDNYISCSYNSSSNNDRNIVADVEVDLERGIGATDGDRDQGSIEMNQQQLRRQ
jgi:hypothetical protein